MSTTEPKTAPIGQHTRQWLDYLLMFVFIVVLNKKYPARSQEPVHRVTWMIIYLIKTPAQALSVYVIGEHVFHQQLLNQLQTLLFVGSVISFWEFIFHRVLHTNKYVLALLKRRNTRRHTQAFMTAYPDLGATLVYINFFIMVGYLCFFCIYMAIVIITPVPRGY